VVIVRGTEITYPFWVGMITRSGADLERGVEESRRPSSKSGPKKSAAASTAATKSRPMRQAAPRRSLKEAAVDSEEEDEEKEMERESDFEAEEEKEEEEEEDEEEEEEEEDDPPAAAAAASSSRKRKGNTRGVKKPAKKRLRGSAPSEPAFASPPLEFTESSAASTEYTVQWYDFLEDQYTRAMKPLDDKAWDAFLKKRFSSKEWNRFQQAKKRFKQGKFDRVPVAVVERWRPVKFLPMSNAQENRGVVNSANIIVYGSTSELLTKDHALKKAIFTRVLNDLTEIKDKQQGFSTEASEAEQQ
jgi:hypothetical protein